MNRKIIGVVAVLGTVLLAACATTSSDLARSELTKEQRPDNLPRDARHLDGVRWERIQVAERQTYDDLKTQPVKPMSH